METVPLDEFIGTNRDEIIRRCKTKVEERMGAPTNVPAPGHGVPAFLEQLGTALRLDLKSDNQICAVALQHGRDLLREGFTLSQVVHDYGDVCQSITDLAVEMNTSISTDHFRTLNKCLDDAIAAAVTEFAREEEVGRSGDRDELRTLTETALAAFAMLESGTVGAAGRTGLLVHRSLTDILALLARPNTTATPQVL